MALVESTVKATIIAKLNAAYGAPADAATQDKLATALAQSIIEILTTQLEGVVNGPVDSNGDSLTDPSIGFS